jgi:hypothetical protein
MNRVWDFLLIPGVHGCLAAVAIFIVAYGRVCSKIKPGSYTFEPRGPGSFEPSLNRYTRLTEFIVGLATGSIVLLAGSSVFHAQGRLPQLYGAPLVLLAMSVVWLVIFIACTTYFYEDWLHHPHNHTHHRYRLSVALGFSGLLCFGVGYVWLGFALMRC